MPPKKDTPSLYDYNIYRIPLEKKESFIEHLLKRQFSPLPLDETKIRNIENFRLDLFFCDKDNNSGSTWIDLLSDCSLTTLDYILQIYGAALVYSNESICFVISYGNAHFYINAFCDMNFGISVAERLIDLETVKAQQNTSFGSRLNKSFFDYFIGASLTYRSGEVPSYIKGASKDIEQWGTTINCGTSAQFKWEEKPLEIGKKLSLLETAIKSHPSIMLPRLTELNESRNEAKINELFHELSLAIKSFDENEANAGLLCIPTFYLLGTRVIQNDILGYRFTCQHKRRAYVGDLTIAALLDFLKIYDLDIETCIRDINITIEYSNDMWTPRKPLTNYMEYINSDNICLRNGKWCIFNKSYLRRIMQEVNKITFTNHTDGLFKFSRDKLIKYAKTSGIYVEQKRQPMETYYNNFIAEQLNAVCVHPTSTPIDPTENKRYHYEICDLYVENTMYFVKIGKTADFAFAVDQAMQTQEQLDFNNKITLPNGNSVEAKNFHFILIFNSRKTLVEKWEDIFSINFLLHLAELKRMLDSRSIRIDVAFSYSLEDVH